MNFIDLMRHGDLLDFTLDSMVGKTYGVIDRKRNAIILRGLEGEERERAVRFIMAAHREHLRWLTVTQRQWQDRTRRPSRARHHDSIAIRERYVRAAA